MFTTYRGSYTKQPNLVLTSRHLDFQILTSRVSSLMHGFATGITFSCRCSHTFGLHSQTAGQVTICPAVWLNEIQLTLTLPFLMYWLVAFTSFLFCVLFYDFHNDIKTKTSLNMTWWLSQSTKTNLHSARKSVHVDQYRKMARMQFTETATRKHCKAYVFKKKTPESRNVQMIDSYMVKFQNEGELTLKDFADDADATQIINDNNTVNNNYCYLVWDMLLWQISTQDQKSRF